MTDIKRVSDILGDGKIDFYPEYPRLDLETQVLGKDWIIMDVQIMKEWKSDFGGTSDWCLICIQDQESGQNYTTKCGGVVLVKRMAELKARKAFPIVGAIVMQGGTERPYYQVI